MQCGDEEMIPSTSAAGPMYRYVENSAMNGIIFMDVMRGTLPMIFFSDLHLKDWAGY